MPCSRLFVFENGASNNTSILRNTATFMPVDKDHQDPVFLSTNLTNQGLVNVVSNDVGCLTTIVLTDNYDIKMLSLMTRKMRYHNIFVTGDRRHNNKELKAHDRPVVWVEELPLVRNIFHVRDYQFKIVSFNYTVQMPHVYNVHLHCPKMNQHHGHEMSVKIVHKRRSKDYHGRIDCPSRLSGQTITLRYIGKSKMVKIGDTEHRAGISGYTFLFLSEILKFKPKLELLDFQVRGNWKRFLKNVSC